MRNSLLMLILVAVFCVASVAVAQDTTFQKWSFDTDANPASPETVTNAYGTPSAVINVEVPAEGWIDVNEMPWGSADGIWDIGYGSIVLNIPNAGTGPVSADVRIKYWVEPYLEPTVELTDSVSWVSKTDPMLIEEDFIGGWYETLWTLNFGSASDLSALTITGDQEWGSMIDEITVSTQGSAVPEPGSLMALGAGLAGLVIRRRRG